MTGDVLEDGYMTQVLTGGSWTDCWEEPWSETLVQKYGGPAALVRKYQENPETTGMPVRVIVIRAQVAAELP